MNTALKLPRTVALTVVSVLVTLGVVVSFMESYRALYWWAQGHAVHGVWAYVWPIQIDAFVAVGELALFVALVDVWHWKHRSLPWIITAAGLVVSVAGNVGHVETHNVFTRLTAAVPPLTAYVMLAAALGLLKRVVANAPKARKPGPKPGTPRAPKTEPEVEEVAPAPEPEVEEDPEAAIKAEAFATLPPGDEPAPRFDPDATLSFPKIVLDDDGNLVSPNGRSKK
jgi:Protein of unknown function (DUF2637)